MMKNPPWTIIAADPAPVDVQMAADYALFESMEAGQCPPTIRVYSWSEPGVTYGYAQSRSVAEAALRAHPAWGRQALRIAQRPTGGGVVWHDVSEVVYCLVAPNDGSVFSSTLSGDYLQITRAIASCLSSLGFPVQGGTSDIGLKKTFRTECFSHADPHELICHGQKVVGSAQRRTRQTILQQGTIKVNLLRGA